MRSLPASAEIYQSMLNLTSSGGANNGDGTRGDGDASPNAGDASPSGVYANPNAVCASPSDDGPSRDGGRGPSRDGDRGLRALRWVRGDRLLHPW